MTSLRVLSRAEVIRALPMPAAIEAVKSAYAAVSAGQAAMPLRSHLSAAQDGLVLTMPAYLAPQRALAIKVVSIYPHNPERGLPRIHALVTVLDAETGQPVAVLDGGALTAIRTGAASGAATDVLARPEARTLAVIGCGVQARRQLEAVCAVRPIESILIYDINRAAAEQFAAEMAETTSARIAVSDSADAAVSVADVVCAATTSQQPVFSGAVLKPGTHINGVGSFTPDMREVDTLTLQRSLIVVDSREAIMNEAGELIHALKSGAIASEAVQTELGEIINGDKPGRTRADQITFFKSVGLAAQDAAAAALVLRAAEQHGLGTQVDW